MRKLLPFIFALTFSLNIAKAETSGHYAGIHLINSKAKARSYSGQTASPLDSRVYTNKRSYGLSYGYAFNFDGFYVMPEIFFDKNNTRNRTTDSQANDVNVVTIIKHTYGLKANLGYDFTDKFSGYFSAGFAEARRRVRADYNSNPWVHSNETDPLFVLGAGLRYDVMDNIAIGASYEINQFGRSTNIFDTSDEMSIDYEVAKLSLFYNF